MIDYQTLRSFADSYFLVVLFISFIGIVLYQFRPSLRNIQQRMANLPNEKDEND